MFPHLLEDNSLLTADHSNVMMLAIVGMFPANLSLLVDMQKILLILAAKVGIQEVRVVHFFQ